MTLKTQLARYVAMVLLAWTLMEVPQLLLVRGGGGVQVATLSCQPNALVERVKAKVLGESFLDKDADVINVDKPMEDNVGRHLLQEFEEESDEEGTLEAGDQGKANPNVPSAPVVKEKKKKMWGPVLDTRMSSRIRRDGKSVIEKARN
jgi:hypothetical protein